MPGVVVTEFATTADALSWLEQEQWALLAAVRLAAGRGFHRHAIAFRPILSMFLQRRGLWRDLASVQEITLGAATAVDDLGAQADAHRALARACTRLGDDRSADKHYRHALCKYGRIGDQRGQGFTHLNRGGLAEKQGRYRQALGHAAKAVDVMEATGDLLWQARALNALSWCHAQLGEHDVALAACRRSLDLLTSLGDPVGQAAAWDSLGYIHHLRANYEEAVACYDNAVRLNQELGDRHHEADTLSRTGDSHRAAGRFAAARTAWQRTYEILRELDPRRAEEILTLLTACPDA
jgi:tetratricopeptide (TPR) repeat protein